MDTHTQTTTLAPLIRAYLVERRNLRTYSSESIRSVRYRLGSLDEHFGRRPLTHLTAQAVKDWIGSLAHLADNSVAAYVASARKFTRWLTAAGKLRVDPCPEIESVARPSSVPRAQPSENVRDLLLSCADARERAMVELMVGMGLRRAEVAGLRWEHYDVRRRTMLVALGAKGKKERLLPVPAAVRRALLALGHQNTGPVICSKRDGHSHLSPATVGNIMSEAMERAGIKSRPYDGVAGHALRHTAASDVLERADYDLRVVQQMLGHSTMSATLIYLRLAAPESIRDAMEGRDYSLPDEADAA